MLLFLRHSLEETHLFVTHTPCLAVVWPIQDSVTTSKRRGVKDRSISEQHLEQTERRMTEIELLRYSGCDNDILGTSRDLNSTYYYSNKFKMEGVGFRTVSVLEIYVVTGVQTSQFNFRLSLGLRSGFSQTQILFRTSIPLYNLCHTSSIDNKI